MNKLTQGQRYTILLAVSSLVLISVVLLNVTSVATAGGIITWSDGTTNNLYQINTDGTGAAETVTGAANTLLDVDTDGTYLYWAENNSLVINYIGRSDFDGSNPQSDWLDTSVVGERTWGIAVNDTHIYWTDTVSDCIYRANIDGTNPITVVDIVIDIGLDPLTQNPNAQDITLDETSIYWTDSTLDKVYKANLDGSGASELIDLTALYGSARPYGIVAYGSYLYWTDGGPDKIYRAGTDGTGAAAFIDPVDIAAGTYGPYGITTDGTYLYWADGVTHNLYKADLTGSNPMLFADPSAVGSTNPRYLTYDLDGTNAVTLSDLQNQTSWILLIAGAGIMVLTVAVVWMRKQKRLPH